MLTNKFNTLHELATLICVANATGVLKLQLRSIQGVEAAQQNTHGKEGSRGKNHDQHILIPGAQYWIAEESSAPQDLPYGPYCHEGYCEPESHTGSIYYRGQYWTS